MATISPPIPMTPRCAGKKMHSSLYSTDPSAQDAIKQMFLRECRQHANLRHPHIVQLLGLYVQPGDIIPTLVMEYMHSSLTACLKHCPEISMPHKKRILYDVTLGLRFLHERQDPIIHRDLTANNVLLTEDLRAKISDLGMAKILPYNVARQMTMAPGTSDYMPPEALVANPVYDTKLDMFSFGILILHVVAQEWPAPHLPTSSRNYSGKLVAHTEAERRANFFSAMDSNDVLHFLADCCLQIDPESRPTARDVAEKLEPTVASSSTQSFPLLSLSQEKEEAEGRRDTLQDLSRGMELQLLKILQDMSNVFTLNEVELDDLRKQLRAIVRDTRSTLYDSGHSSYDPTQNRFIVAYKPPVSVSGKDKEVVALTISSASPTHPYPVSVTVHSPVNMTFSGTYVKTVITNLTKPFGVAVSGDELYVVDNGGWYGVHICSISGKGPDDRSIILSSSKADIIRGMPLEKCWYPTGVTIDSEMNVIVVDCESHRVLKFNPDGTFLASSGKLMERGSEVGEFCRPVHIALASNGDLYVCDRGNHRVQILNSNLMSKRCFGGLGTGQCQFHHPWDVAFDSKGNVYVADCSNYCVKVFTKEFGEFVRQIGKQGIGDGDFQAPVSICVDSNDYLFVVDKKLHCVKIFSPTGDFVMRFGGVKHEKPEFRFQKPRGIAVDGKGQVFVSDSDNKRVLMFR